MDLWYEDSSLTIEARRKYWPLSWKKEPMIFIKDIVKIPCVFFQNIILAIAIVNTAGNTVLSVLLKYLPQKTMEISNIHLSVSLRHYCLYIFQNKDHDKFSWKKEILM